MKFNLAPQLAPMIIIGICALAQAGDFIAIWQYDQFFVARGEYWRLLTAHFVHLNWLHFFLNLAALLLIWQLLFETARAWYFLAALLVLNTVISICLYLFDADIIWYVGLSGSLHGLFVLGIAPLVQQKRAVAIIAASILLLKLIAEQTLGPLSRQWFSNDQVIVNAHLYGAIAGSVWFIIGGIKTAAFHQQR